MAGAHVYVSWTARSLKRIPIARYDPPSATPVWHRRSPARQGRRTGSDLSYPDSSNLLAYPDPSGHADIVSFYTGDTEGRRWFLRPDTGTVIGPRAGIRRHPDDEIFGVSGGRAYLDTASSTKILDPHTGAVVRTINPRFDGITTNGYLIARGPNTISAYRWK